MKSFALLSLLVGSALAQNAAKPLSFNLKPAQASPPAGKRILEVMVGMGSPPGFMPSSVQAQPGDTVRFMFMGANNSVMQTTFDAPCQAKAGGFNSGFKPNANNAMPPPTADLQVKDTQPLWMTSQATGACGSGMVFSVNPPANQPLDMFQSKAVAAGAPNLKNAAIVVNQPVAQVASTVSIRPGNVAAAGATGTAGAQPSVVAGQGTTGNGQSCTCQCLCGSNSFPAGTNAGVGAFGGFLGMMPAGAMSAPAPAAASAPRRL